MRNDVSVVMTVLAVEPDNVPEIVGMTATSIAISISDIPLMDYWHQHWTC